MPLPGPHPDDAEQKPWSPCSLETWGPLPNPRSDGGAPAPSSRRGEQGSLLIERSRPHTYRPRCPLPPGVLCGASVPSPPGAENSVNLRKRNLLPAAPRGADAPSCWAFRVSPRGSQNCTTLLGQQSPLGAPKATP